MQRTEILICAGRREREREFVFRIERLRLEELAARGDDMRDVVVVDPDDARASLHGDALRSERELVNFHLRIRSLRRGSGKRGGRGEDRGRKRSRDADLACPCAFQDFAPADAAAVIVIRSHRQSPLKPRWLPGTRVGIDKIYSRLFPEPVFPDLLQ
jgi:hypothetical protein